MQENMKQLIHTMNCIKQQLIMEDKSRALRARRDSRQRGHLEVEEEA